MKTIAVMVLAMLTASMNAQESHSKHETYIPLAERTQVWPSEARLQQQQLMPTSTPEAITVQSNWKGADIARGVEAVILLALGGIVYFIPSIIAAQRGHLAASGVLFVNLFLGWTVVGWWVCLIWAYTGRRKADVDREDKHHQELLAAMAAGRQPWHNPQNRGDLET